LIQDKYFIQYNYEETIKKLVDLFSDINALHPFREGNGRSQREFIEELAKINGIDLDLTQVSKMDMIIASHEAINGHNDKLHKLFTSNVEVLSKEEQLYFINLYCSKKIAKEIMEFLN
jgi:cell filamentation protein